MALNIIEYKISKPPMSKHKRKVPIICRIFFLIKYMKRINVRPVTRIFQNPLVKEFLPILYQIW